MRYLIKVSYDGSKFFGFQRLNQNKTVQKTIENALSFIDKANVCIKGAGRTDRGVHALDQGIHFDLEHDIPESGLMKVLNRMLMPYIVVHSCCKVTDDFHARFFVKEKTYRYRIYFGEYNPCFFDYCFECPYEVNVKLMEEASKYMLGIHDFHNFVSGERSNYQAIVSEISFFQHDKFLDIFFTGKSFYRYMVRNLVGALLDLGRGKCSIEDITYALESKNQKQFTTAISNGLCLYRVDYGENLDKFII